MLLFLAVISGFAGLYVGGEVFPSVKTPLDAFYISSFTLALTDYTPKPGYGQLVVLAQLGYEHAEVQGDGGCGRVRVVVRGYPNLAGADDAVAEASRVGLHPTVEADAAP